ncbi:MAG: N-acetylmuramoyl-L-alanine amidase [Patescibacteria group bacterium]
MNYKLRMRYYFTVILLITLLAVPWLAVNYPEQTDFAYSVAKGIENSITGSLASAILARSPKSVQEIQARYTPTSPKKVRVLLVPGHEPGYGGAEYGDLKERDINVELADDLARFLNENGRYEVITTRTATDWNPVFADYFKTHWDEIDAWQKQARMEARQMVSVGQLKPAVVPVNHNNVRPDIGLRLFGITKWANENDIDITIHIHVNDDPRHNSRVAGEHSGFAIYVPEHQLGNSSTTQAIAANVFKRLERYNPTSDLAVEAGGFIEEPELIAIGVNNTAAAASMLIEYGYIYEQQFTNPEVHTQAINDLAFQTYLGLQDFFGSGNNITRAYDTLMLPRNFNRQMSKTGYKPEDVFALQTALILEGAYPPSATDKNACPRTGRFGPCTEEALAAFQKKHQITDEKGVVGTKTLGVLNQLYSVNQQK